MKLNLPNKLVILRIVLTFAIVGLLLAIPFTTDVEFFKRYVFGRTVHCFSFHAMALFIIASATDWLDGHLARKNNQVTDFGKLFDPIADKILVNTTLIIFAVQTRIPVWIVLIFVIRDLLVEGLRMSAAAKGKVIAAGQSGKVKTVLQMIGLVTLFVFYPDPTIIGNFDYASIMHLSLLPIYLGLIASIYSGFEYYKNGFKEVMGNV